MRHWLALLLLFLPFTSSAVADEYLWLYTRSAETLPANSWEISLGDISRIDKNSGDYVFNELEAELEYGITDRLTARAALLVFDHHYRNVEWAPMVDTQGGPGGSYDNTQLGGIDAELKYNVWSPYKDWLGVSFGFAYEHRQAYRLDGARINQDSMIPKLYLQKNFRDDTLIAAFRGAMELERRESPGVLEEEIAFDLAGGVSYRFAPNWYVGIESRWQSDFLSPEVDGNPPEGRPSSWDFGNFQLGDQFQQAVYVGPSIHYAQKNWWVTVGALYQVWGWSADGPAASNEGKNWDEHERVHLGVIFGFEFGGRAPRQEEYGSFKR